MHIEVGKKILEEAKQEEMHSSVSTTSRCVARRAKPSNSRNLAWKFCCIKTMMMRFLLSWQKLLVYQIWMLLADLEMCGQNGGEG